MLRVIRPQLVSLEARCTPAATRGLDLTFNTSGLLDVAFDLGGSKADIGAAVAVQPDGKIVVVGSAQVSGTDVDFAILRLNPDGTLDTTFGDSGRRVVGFDIAGDKVDRASAVRIQPDGAIVVAGIAQADAGTDFDFAILRLTKTGELDTTFDKDGRQTVAFDIAGGTFEDLATAVNIDSKGRILVAGSVATATPGDYDFGIARLLGNGSIDISFDGDGQNIVSFNAGGNKSDLVASVLIDGANQPIIAGSIQTGANGFDFGLVRLTESGVLDAGFNGTGTATVAFNLGGNNSDVVAGAAFDAAGRILVAGTVATPVSGNSDLGLARFTINGSLDTTFNGSGKRTYNFDLGGTGGELAAGLAVNHPTGSIVLAATVETAVAGNNDIGVLRLTGTGDIDLSFSPNGRAVVAFDRGGTNSDRAGGVAFDASGRVVIAATADTTAPDRNIGIARLVANTSLSQSLVAGGPTDGSGIGYRTDGTNFISVGPIAGPSGTTVARPVSADLNADGIPDTIFAAGPSGGSRIRIVLGSNPSIGSVAPIEFDAFEGGFEGGVFVAAGDVDGDGRDEFAISPDVGGGPRASVYSIGADNKPVKRADFFGIDDPNFRGGARVAMGDVNADGRADLVVGAGFLGGPRVAIFAGATLFNPGPDGTPPKLVNDFFAFPGQDAQTLRNGVFVAVGDLDGDGFGDLIFGGGPGGGPRVFALEGSLIVNQQYDTAYLQPIANFFVAGDSTTRGGVRLAVKDLDGDKRADLITASGDGLPSGIRVYRGATIEQPNGTEPPLAQAIDPFAAVLASGVFVG